MLEIKYYAWLSSKEAARVKRCGAKFAGFVRDLPAEFEYLKADSENRQYCAIRNIK